MTGFAGSHLADVLLAHRDVEVFGVGLPADSQRNVDHLAGRAALFREDLGDPASVRRLLETVRPDQVYHLAAQAAVGRSWANPAETLVNNIVAQANLLQVLLELSLPCRVLVVGSGDEYGLVAPEDLPVDEDTPLRPLNPYAVSKVAQDYLGYQYHLGRGLPVVRVRPFNHIGPRQGPGFVVPDFCRQIAETEAGRRDPVMRVGNLEARRDFTDVRDMMRGYHLALTRGQPGEVYNLGSGRAYSIREILERLLSMTDAAISVETDPERMRPSDIPTIVCDSHRFREATGWRPERRLDDTLKDALDYWRRRVAAERGIAT